MAGQQPEGFPYQPQQHQPHGHGHQHVHQQAQVQSEEENDKQVLELLQMMDSFTPVIPDALTDYLMIKAGVECDDVRLKRLVALISQKFITDIATDALHYAKQRMSGPGAAKSGAVAGPSGGPKKMVLTMEDLSAALADHGVNIRRPNYFT